MTDNSPGTPGVSGDSRLSESPESGTEWLPGQRVHAIFNGVLILIGVGYLSLISQLTVIKDDAPGPGFFPLVAVLVFLGCMVLDSVRLVRLKVTDGWSPSTGKPSFRAVALLASIAAYIGLVWVLGHAVTAAIVTFALVWVLGKRRIWQLLLIAVIAGAGTDYLFSAVLGLRLPDGLIGLGF